MVKSTLRRTALTPSSAAMLSLFGAARKTTFRITSGLDFNQQSRWGPLRYGATAKFCEHGRCFFAVTIALFLYEKLFPQTSGCSVRCPQRSVSCRTMAISPEDNGLYSTFRIFLRCPRPRLQVLHPFPLSTPLLPYTRL